METITNNCTASNSSNSNPQQHHLLRSLTLAKLLTENSSSPATTNGCHGGDLAGGLTGGSSGGVGDLEEIVKPSVKINKQNVQNLVDGFFKLNFNEKLLFLVGINGSQEGGLQQQKGGNNSIVASGSTPPPPEQQPTTTTTTRTTTPTTTDLLPPPSTPPPIQPSLTTTTTSSQSRLTTTTTFLLENFTPDMSTALPKHEVYDFYYKSLLLKNQKPISTADFGKLMRQVFPSVKARRLGQRGASKYCYANIRKKSEYDLETPKIPEVKLSLIEDFLFWGKNSFGVEFSNLDTLFGFLKSHNFKSFFLTGRKRRNSSFSNIKKVNKNDGVDVEIEKYFLDEDSIPSDSNSSCWPHLRSLLATNNSNPGKKRHSSNNIFKKEPKNEFLETFSNSFRSASVPIFVESSNNLFGFGGSRCQGDGDSGYDSVVSSNNNTPVVLFDGGNNNNNGNNPLLSSHSLGDNNEDNNVVISGFDSSSIVHENDDEVMFDSVFDLIVAEGEAAGNNGSNHSDGGGGNNASSSGGYF